MALGTHHNTSQEEECEMDQLLNELYTSNDDDDDDEVNSSVSKDDARHDHDEELQLHGGLENLGNTCYMASALQMLASATGFIEALEKEHTSPSLRRAVTDVIQRLLLGETVRPEAFKQAVDQRSPLFHGYRQQDANELLVTLLDLLDEEYKSVGQEPTTTEVEESSTCCNRNASSDPIDLLESSPNTSNIDIGESIDNKTEAAEEGDEKSTTTTVDATPFPEEALDDEDQLRHVKEESCGDDDTVTVATSATDSTISEQHSLSGEEEETSQPEDSISSSTVEVESSAKKARLSEPNEWLVKTTTSAASPPPLQRPSFSSFTLTDIGRLLHGDPTDALILPDISTTCLGNEPHYKLVGGRMNTSDVVLTPIAEYQPEVVSSPTVTTDSVPTVEPVAEATTITTDCSQNDTISTPIDSYFQTSVRIKLTCDSCHYTRRHTETFWQLSLEIGADQHVEDALRRFFAPCKQELKCEKCFCDTATQTMELQELPPYLLLHFKRFIVDVSPDYSSVSYRKDGSPVFFQETLSFPDDYHDAEESSFGLESSAEYSLISVVHHIGASASCGHYTADAKRNGVWTRFNDSTVDRITEAEAIDESSRHTAYMVLYQLNDEIQR